jgi:FAD/FMN-containing dehydrogenase
VKNVTGYDLHRLYTGSRGSLCVILEASLRLFPAPESEVVITSAYFGRDAALEAASAVLASNAKPTCVCVTGPADGRWTTTIALSGRTDVVAWERLEVERIVGTTEVRTGAAARASVEALRDREIDASLRASVLPGRLRSLLERLDAAVAVRHSTATMVVQPGIATIDVELAGADGSSLPAEPSVSVARVLTACGAEVELRNAPLEARAAHDPLSRLDEPARELMARLKKSLDPAGRFAGAPGA